MPKTMTEITPANIPEYSVTELSQVLKQSIEERFAYVRLRGEISGFKAAASGHVYFALKDTNAKIDAILWRGVASALRFRPEDGLEVIATGKLTTYPGRSSYQIIVERMEVAGVGALMALLEERRQKLLREGLFDPARKRALPYLPRTIGVITSPTGAVIRDILHRLTDRFGVHVVLWPVLVQGEGAATQIAAAVQGFNAFTQQSPTPKPDVLIIARGGGSIEDLWAFNDEALVRAIANSQIPTISAVGHETDTTLCDFAADKRAPTPSAAAEMAVPVRADLAYTLGELGLRLSRAPQSLLDRQTERVRSLARALAHPRSGIELATQRLDELCTRLPRALAQNSQKQKNRLDILAAKLAPSTLAQRVQNAQQRLEREARSLTQAQMRSMEHAARKLDQNTRLMASLSPKAVLGRGYALVRTFAGRVVTSAATARDEPELQIEFADGYIKLYGSPEAAATPALEHKALRQKAKPQSDSTKQGQLL
jgi:exodeoxyribonuclease VII large subunit